MSKVGPGHPPKSKRFRKGVSGNPAGRPRKERPAGPASAFAVVIDRKLTVTQDGKSREVTVEEALQHKTYQNAIADDRSAQREVLKMIAKREAHFNARKAKKPAPRNDVKIVYPPTDADEALLVLGIATRHPACEDLGADREQLLLEPWAVQAALGQRRGSSKLTEQEIEGIQRCTRDAATLRWQDGTAE